MTREQTAHKAIVALLGAILTIAGLITHESIDVDPEIIGSIGTLLTTALVYFVPNKEK